jgi:hypothetical protein
MRVPKGNSRKLLKSVGGEGTGVILATDVVRIRAFRDFLSEDEVFVARVLLDIDLTSNFCIGRCFKYAAA